MKPVRFITLATLAAFALTLRARKTRSLRGATAGGSKTGRPLASPAQTKSQLQI